MIMKRLSFYWSTTFLNQSWILYALFWANLLGTLYGYEWYRQQLVATWNSGSSWLVLFVPDSPTASLFFVIVLLFLIKDDRQQQNGPLIKAINGSFGSLRSLIEALAVITLVKYGIWAVIIIFWGAAQGDVLVWQEWMLVVSHSCMALQAILYMRLMYLHWFTILVAALWTLTNDYIDYTFGVYPYLPRVLDDQLLQVQLLTISLGLIGIACALIGSYIGNKNKV
jgi:uncharacterized membrane protein YpjA